MSLRFSHNLDTCFSLSSAATTETTEESSAKSFVVISHMPHNGQYVCRLVGEYISHVIYHNVVKMIYTCIAGQYHTYIAYYTQGVPLYYKL